MGKAAALESAVDQVRSQAVGINTDLNQQQGKRHDSDDLSDDGPEPTVEHSCKRDAKRTCDSCDRDRKCLLHKDYNLLTEAD